MKKVILTISSCLLAAIAHAQMPALLWTKSMGGTSDEAGRSVALDASGNVYTTGYYQGTSDFDPGSAKANLTSSGDSDIFISKLNASGNLVWAKSIGGSSSDGGRCIVADGDGNIYVTGYFSGTVDFDPGNGTSNLSSNGGNDIFILKLNASGNYIWAINMGGSENDRGNALTTDVSGNVYSTGYFQSNADFDPGSNSYNLSSNGNKDIYMAKYTSSGSLVWASGSGGSGDDVGFAVALDASGNLHTSGYFSSSVDFDPGSGTSSLTSAGDFDIFISKLDGAGNYIWAVNMGGSGTDVAWAIKVDSDANVYTTGYIYGTADLNPGSGTYNLTSAGYNDIFISKLDASGSFVWAKKMGGTYPDGGTSLALDASGNIYATGWFNTTVDFDPGSGTYNISTTGSNTLDVFILKLNNAGNFIWARNEGGTGNDIGWGIALDASGNMYCIGEYRGKADFNPANQSTYLTSAGGSDVFAFKMNQSSKREGTTDLDHSLFNNSISIYPNPNNGIFELLVSYPVQGASLEIYNIIGELVYKLDNVSEKNTIDLSQVTNGLYIIKLLNGNNIVSTIKIIK